MNQCYLYEAKETAEILAQLVAAGKGARLRIRIDTAGKPWTKALGSKDAAPLTHDEIDRAHVCPPEPIENCET